MIQMLITESSDGERLFIKEYSRQMAARYTEETWKYYMCRSAEELVQFVSDRTQLDMLCMDITIPDVLTLTKKIRGVNRTAFLILIADMSISPTEYMKPSVMAGNLILKPLSKETVTRTLEESFRAFADGFENPDLNEVFVAESREGRWLIPYDRILYFEAREKKVFVNTADQQIGFYDTLDELERKLPEGFLRCHRSFIINRSKVDCLQPSSNTILLKDGVQIPVSRTYRSVMRELRGR
jgi:DNA-binding LytR/AlgR family response regulator